jgi:hypothetical protein
MLTKKCIGNLCAVTGGIGALGAADPTGIAIAGASAQTLFGLIGTMDDLGAGTDPATRKALRRFRDRVESNWRRWAPRSSNPDAVVPEAHVADFNDFFENHATALDLSPQAVAALRTEASAAQPAAVDRETARRLADTVLAQAAGIAPILYKDTAERQPSRAFFRAIVQGAFCRIAQRRGLSQRPPPADAGRGQRRDGAHRTEG